MDGLPQMAMEKQPGEVEEKMLCENLQLHEAHWAIQEHMLAHGWMHSMERFEYTF